jgi:outer membrane murein-binding lipoprotein Lpp
MDTLSAIIALLKELGTPAITVIGFGWVLFRFNKLDAKVSSEIAKLEAKISSDIAKLEAKVGDLKADVKSIKNNHLPHIEAAIKELSKGTLNEDHVKAILDLSHEPDDGKQ